MINLELISHFMSCKFCTLHYEMRFNIQCSIRMQRTAPDLEWLSANKRGFATNKSYGTWNIGNKHELERLSLRVEMQSTLDHTILKH